MRIIIRLGNVAGRPVEGHAFGAPVPSRRWGWRLAERTLLVAGLALLSVYAAAMVDRISGSRAAIREIEDIKPAESAPAVTDFSLWSEKRVKEFQRSQPLAEAQPLAVLSIDRIKIKAPVFAGTDELALNRGLGWVAGTSQPGSPGNTGIAGHRDGFFRALKDVRVGDTVDLKTRQARQSYRVEKIEIVKPEDVAVLRPREATSMTLVTCYPFYFIGDAPQRFIVHATLENQIEFSASTR